jgi:hypothetical protein
VTSDDRAATAALLRAAHPGDDRFADTAWLDWLYDDNPVGTAFERSRDLEGERIGHVAVLPQRWRQGDRRTILLCTVNAATAPSSGRMVFAGLIARVAADAAETSMTGYGVTNDASSIPALARLHARLIGPLRVVVAVPSPPKGVQSLAVDETTLDDEAIATMVADAAERVASDWSQDWSVETLRWRLSAPRTRYALHWTDDVIAVSVRTTVRHVPVGVLLKLLPRRGPVPAAVTRRVVGAVHRHHRVPAVIYAGFNGLAPVSGIRVPGRLRPGPLNLVVIGAEINAALQHAPELSTTGVSTDELVFETFELLDFDAL